MHDVLQHWGIMKCSTLFDVKGRMWDATCDASLCTLPLGMQMSHHMVKRLQATLGQLAGQQGGRSEFAWQQALQALVDLPQLGQRRV
jgi:hypothetical protein